MRMATVPRVSPRSQVSDGWWLATRVSAPGPEGVDELPGLLGEVGDEPVQGVRGADEDGRGHAPATALGLQEVTDGLAAEGVRTDAVHGVGGQHDQLAAADRGGRFAQTGPAVGRVAAVVSPSH
ncbi:hypothetical protein GCM10020221_06340 [Streptomyces thioluteus]|uniref:Uncharacterized protein n=1 Tax=Streptomyces thioluteus TaxID=66431 RepID=A0ABN3WFX2_STRTU